MKKLQFIMKSALHVLDFRYMMVNAHVLQTSRCLSKAIALSLKDVLKLKMENVQHVIHNTLFMKEVAFFAQKHSQDVQSANLILKEPHQPVLNVPKENI